jgi:hypothetical protein
MEDLWFRLMMEYYLVGVVVVFFWTWYDDGLKTAFLIFLFPTPISPVFWGMPIIWPLILMGISEEIEKEIKRAYTKMLKMIDPIKPTKENLNF